MSEIGRRPTSYQRRRGNVSPRRKQLIENSQWLIKDLSGGLGHPEARWHLEIGFGNGEYLLSRARQKCEHFFLGVELYVSGLGAVLATVEREAMQNVFLWQGDAIDFLEALPKDIHFASIEIPHPDPWPKKRQHKRRLINAHFLENCVERLLQEGTIRILSDDTSYTEHIIEVLEHSKKALVDIHRNVPPRTKYGEKAVAEGRPITEIILTRKTITS